MKKAEEYLEGKYLHTTYHPNGDVKQKPIHDDDCHFCYYEEKVLEAIKQAQIDAIDAAVKMCAEDADTHSMWEEDSQTYYESIDKDSILQVADKLKKGL